MVFPLAPRCTDTGTCHLDRMVGRLSTACIFPLTLCAPWGAQAWSSTSPACPGVVTPQIVVTVIDQADGLYLCDAVVTASDSSSTYAATPPHNQTVSDAGYFVCPGKSGTSCGGARKHAGPDDDAAGTHGDPGAVRPVRLCETLGP